jgi:hypothetical protein
MFASCHVQHGVEIHVAKMSVPCFKIKSCSEEWKSDAQRREGKGREGKGREGTSDQTDPNMVEGPWKHHPPTLYADNDKPLVTRKKRNVVTSGGHGTKATKVKTTVEEMLGTPHPPTLSNERLDDSSDARSHSGMPKPSDAENISSGSFNKNEEPEEEGDITELSMICFPLSVSH